jgi:hypothetical protein
MIGWDGMGWDGGLISPIKGCNKSFHKLSKGGEAEGGDDRLAAKEAVSSTPLAAPVTWGKTLDRSVELGVLSVARVKSVGVDGLHVAIVGVEPLLVLALLGHGGAQRDNGQSHNTKAQEQLSVHFD